MGEWLSYVIIVAVAAYVLWRLITAKGPPIEELKGKKLLYVDQGRSKVFKNKTHNIQCKPDYIYRVDRNNDAIVEYKNRQKNIFPSDEVQMTASALAARSKYPNITIGYIYLEDGTYRKYNLSGSDDELVRKIEPELKSARMAAMKRDEPVRPNARKCNVCSVRYACNYVGMGAKQ